MVDHITPGASHTAARGSPLGRSALKDTLGSAIPNPQSMNGSPMFRTGANSKPRPAGVETSSDGESSKMAQKAAGGSKLDSVSPLWKSMASG